MTDFNTKSFTFSCYLIQVQILLNTFEGNFHEVYYISIFQSHDEFAPGTFSELLNVLELVPSLD